MTEVRHSQKPAIRQIGFVKVDKAVDYWKAGRYICKKSLPMI